MVKAQSTLDARHKFQCKSFDVACVQCGHPHSHQQVPFAGVALHVASRVLCGLGLTTVFVVSRCYVPLKAERFSMDTRWSAWGLFGPAPILRNSCLNLQNFTSFVRCCVWKSSALCLTNPFANACDVLLISQILSTSPPQNTHTHTQKWNTFSGHSTRPKGSTCSILSVSIQSMLTESHSDTCPHFSFSLHY